VPGGKLLSIREGGQMRRIWHGGILTQGGFWIGPGWQKFWADTVERHGKFAGMDNLDELYERWVTPFYVRLLHGNFRHFLLAEEVSDERGQMISAFQDCLATVDPTVVAALLHQPDWRVRLAGSWYAGLRDWPQFTDELGAMLVESQMCFAGQGYCVALACFADAASATHLCRYLDVWLPRVENRYDQDWALPALVWVDQQLGTNYAARYLAPGGLWEQWAGLQERQDYYLNTQRHFDLMLASALAAFRTQSTTANNL
jgi:hypothetical protein